MPRIDAPTVAEHRALKQQQIVRGAMEILLADGPDAVTPAAVARAADLARTSVYQYYASSGALLGAAVEELFEQARQSIMARMAEAGDDPRDRLRAYLRVALESTANGRPHDPAAMLHSMPDHCQARLRELLDEMSSPLVVLLAELGVRSPRITAHFLVGALNSAASLIKNGADPAGIEDELIRFADHALG